MCFTWLLDITKIPSLLPCDRILDQYDARVSAKALTSRGTGKEAPSLPYDSVVAMDQLLMQFER